MLLAKLSLLALGLGLAHPINEVKQPPEGPPLAPRSLSILACRADDLTGQAGRHGVDEQGVYHPEFAAKGWKDLELHIEQGELECQVDVQDHLEDASLYSSKATADMIKLNPDFSNFAQCSSAGAVLGQEWNEKHPGWVVVGVGCPVPIMNYGKDAVQYTDDDELIGWRMPDCPSHLPGSPGVHITCKFSKSDI